MNGEPTRDIMNGEPTHTASNERMAPESSERTPQLSVVDLKVKWPLRFIILVTLSFSQELLNSLKLRN